MEAYPHTTERRVTVMQRVAICFPGGVWVLSPWSCSATSFLVWGLAAHLA